MVSKFLERRLRKVDPKVPGIVVTVDLDSTIADTRHRWNLVNAEDKSLTDWVAYSMACANDEPLKAAVHLVHLLQDHYTIWFVSGRNEEARELTEQWLDNLGFEYDGLLLDGQNEGDGLSIEDFRESHSQYKLRRILEVEDITGSEVYLHVDDWAAIKPLLEENNIPCLIVSPCYGEAPGHSGEGGGSVAAGA